MWNDVSPLGVEEICVVYIMCVICTIDGKLVDQSTAREPQYQVLSLC